MASPFPGMDPYLEDEKIWPVFHHHLINCLYQMLLPGLVDRYRARVGQRSYTTEQPLFTSIIRQEHQEEYIEIRQRSDGRLTTLVEVISPANKTTHNGRQVYLEKREEARRQKSNLVEIDLVMQGRPLLDFSREGLPDWDQAVTVTRAVHPERHEVYTTSLQKKLPKFRLPLAPDDRDTVVDLQAAITRCYDTGDFKNLIDYKKDPATRLSDENRQWLEEILKQAKLR